MMVKSALQSFGIGTLDGHGGAPSLTSCGKMVYRSGYVLCIKGFLQQLFRFVFFLRVSLLSRSCPR